jgi:hypothetical protein
MRIGVVFSPGHDVQQITEFDDRITLSGIIVLIE